MQLFSPAKAEPATKDVPKAVSPIFFSVFIINTPFVNNYSYEWHVLYII